MGQRHVSDMSEFEAYVSLNRTGAGGSSRKRRVIRSPILLIGTKHNSRPNKSMDSLYTALDKRIWIKFLAPGKRI